MDLQSIPLGRLAGVVLVLATALPALVTVAVALFGDIRAMEAMFRGLEPAMGQRRSLQIGALTWAVWALGSLAGFVILAFTLAEASSRVLPALSVIGFAIFATAVAVEAAFHVGVTSWAVSLLEDGRDVPELYEWLRGWLNVSLQIIVNPLAVLAYVAMGIAILQTGLLPAWVGWLLIAWIVIIVFPLPLLLAPAPVVLGIALLAFEPQAT